MATDPGPIRAEYRQKMRALASAIDQLFNEHMEHRDVGFALLLFPFDDADCHVSYISNANRLDMHEIIREWLDHVRGLGAEAGGEFQPGGDSSR